MYIVFPILKGGMPDPLGFPQFDTSVTLGFYSIRVSSLIYLRFETLLDLVLSSMSRSLVIPECLAWKSSNSLLALMETWTGNQ